MSIIIKDVFHYYSGLEAPILKNINLKIELGETVAIMGASGSGKSTLLDLISTKLNPSKGTIHLTENEITDISYIKQSALDMVFPWKTVTQNIEFPQKERKKLNSGYIDRSMELMEKMRLSHRKRHIPHMLSGGELKRLSIACGLSYSPRILLIDEAFSGVDFSLKLEIWSFLKNEIRNRKITTLIITHDFDEALFLADRILFFDTNGSLFSDQIPISNKYKERNGNIEKLLADHDIVKLKKEAIKSFKKACLYETT